MPLFRLKGLLSRSLRRKPRDEPRQNLCQGQGNTKVSQEQDCTVDKELAEGSVESVTSDALDLWQVAFDRLKAEQKDRLSQFANHNLKEGKSNRSVTDILNEIIEKTKKVCGENEKDLCQKERAGEGVSVQNAANKILDAALSSNQLISSVVACDASGYASIGWSVLSLGLKMVQNDRDSRAAIMESSQVIAHSLAQSVFTENQYRRGDAELRSTLKGPMVNSYHAILCYAAEVVHAQDLGHGKRVAKSLIPKDQQSLQILQTSLREQDKILQDLKLGHYLSQASKANEILNEIYCDSRWLKTEKQKEIDNEVLNWLSNTKDYNPDQNQHLEKRAKGTLELLFESEEFTEWEDPSEDKLSLYCEGQPGAGKTVATATVIQHLRQKCLDPQGQGSRGIGIAFIYCKDQKTPEPTELLRILLKQLCLTKPSLPTCLTQLHKECKRIGKLPNSTEVIRTLKTVIRHSYSQVFVAIDALDEYERTNREKLLNQILNIQEEIQQENKNSQDPHAHAHLHLFATSRSDVSVKSILKDALFLEIEASPADVKKYLSGEMEILTDLEVVRGNDDLKESAMKTITTSASGSFYYSTLYLDSLKFCGTVNEVKKKLENPPTLAEFYANIIERIKSKGCYGYASRILHCLAFARKDLTLEELRSALAVRQNHSFLDQNDVPSITHVGSICAGLVVVNWDSNIIDLSHHTVKEYLIDTLQIDFPLAKICITYLLFEEFETSDCGSKEEMSSRLQSHPFYAYAAQQWASHFQDCQADSDIEELAIQLLRSPAVASFSQVLQSDQGRKNQRQISWHTGMSGLHVAALSGLSDIVTVLLETEKLENLNALDCMGRTPLFLATQNRKYSIIQRLMAAGAETETQDAWGNTPLLAAIHNIDFEATELLIQNGAIVDTPDHKGRTPLSWAVEHGVEGIAELLITNGAMVDFQDNQGRSPLSFELAESGRKVVGELLLSNGADASLIDAYGRTPLSWAAQIYYTRMDAWSPTATSYRPSGLDFDDGPALDLVDCYGWTAHIWKREAAILENIISDRPADTPSLLQLPMGRSTTEYIDSVLDEVIDTLDPLKPDSHGRTPISILAQTGKIQYLEQALENGVSPDTVDPHGDSLISWAAKYGHYQVVVMLLNHGADPNLADSFNRTPLSWAAAGGMRNIISVLLDEGARSDTKDCNGQTPLSLASQSGDYAVVKLLMQKSSIHSDTPDNWKRTPLSWAAKVGNRRAVKALLDTGDVEIDSSDIWGWTPLSRAAYNGCAVVVQDLLEEGADPNRKDQKGRSPLLRAAQRGATPAVSSLLSSNLIEVDAFDLCGRTPLSWASEFGHEKVVKVLVLHGADAQVVDSSGRNPLSWAAQRGRKKVVETLASKGAGAEIHDHDGRTPVSWAAEYGHIEIIEILLRLDKRILDSADSYGWTPLIWAARYGHETSVKFLLAQRANPNSRSTAGRTALSLAFDHGHEGVVAILREECVVEGA